MRSTILVDTSDARLTQEMLFQVFAVYGRVDGVDLALGQAFGFVRMSNEPAARHAIAALNGQSYSGIKLNVRAAHEVRDHGLRRNAKQPQ
jgi:hypothetical protein